MTLVKKFLMKNNKILKNNNFITNEFFDNEIIINFSSTPTNLQINKSALKYNKDFAYSFTLDDGFSSAYNIAYLLFQGSLITGGTFTSGLTYTDGCGNDLNFKLGLSIYSLNINGSDVHINTPNWLTWSNITELVDFDWDIYNHGYHAGITGNTYSEYYNEIKNNYDNILSKTGYKCSHFIIPNGEDGYIEPAWDYGVLSQSANKNAFTWSGVSHAVSTTGVTIQNSINLNQFCMNKNFVYTITGISAADTTIINSIDNIATNSIDGTKLWWYQFTHDILTNTGSSAGNLNLNTFNYLWYHVYDTYGKNGTDKIWVAPFQEVYDYLYVRDNTNITYSINGNSVRIKLNQSTSFNNLRRYQLSLNVSNDTANIESIILDGYTNYSYNGTGTTSSLINLDWSYGTITLAEKYVSQAENNKTQSDINKAQYFVNKIHIENIKNQYQTRINNIIIPKPKILIDFGYTVASITTGITFSGETSIWNQYSSYLSGGTPYTLTNVQGTLTTNSIYIISGFTGRQGFGAQTGDDSGIYPDSRILKYVYGTISGGGSIHYIGISGLTNTSTYKFIFMGSSTNNTAHSTNYTINSTTVTLATGNNTQNSVNITNISPTNGVVIIKINGSISTHVPYLNILEIVEL